MTVVAQTLTDGSIATAMNVHDTQAEAMSGYYSELAAAIVSKSVVQDAVYVVDAVGSVLASNCVSGAGELAEADGAVPSDAPQQS